MRRSSSTLRRRAAMPRAAEPRSARRCIQKLDGTRERVSGCAPGEAGLRVGEVKALRWREDVDMIARTLTVKQQTCNGVTTTPKGRTRRTVPMTRTLYDALKRMSTIREGFVV